MLSRLICEIAIYICQAREAASAIVARALVPQLRHPPAWCFDWKAQRFELVGRAIRGLLRRVAGKTVVTRVSIHGAPSSRTLDDPVSLGPRDHVFSSGASPEGEAWVATELTYLSFCQSGPQEPCCTSDVAVRPEDRHVGDLVDQLVEESLEDARVLEARYDEREQRHKTWEQFVHASDVCLCEDHPMALRSK